MLAALMDSMSASASVKAVRRTRTVSGDTRQAPRAARCPVIPGIRWSLITTRPPPPAPGSRAPPRAARRGGPGSPWRGGPSSESRTRASSSTMRTVASSVMPLRAREREAHREDGAAVRQAVGADLAAVLLDDLVADREPEPGALADRLGGEERVEDPADDVGRDAGAGVADARTAVASSAPGLDGDRARPWMAWAALARRLRRTWSICERTHSTGGSSPNFLCTVTRSLRRWFSRVRLDSSSSWRSTAARRRPGSGRTRGGRGRSCARARRPPGSPGSSSRGT